MSLQGSPKTKQKFTIALNKKPTAPYALPSQSPRPVSSPLNFGGRKRSGIHHAVGSLQLFASWAGLPAPAWGDEHLLCRFHLASSSAAPPAPRPVGEGGTLGKTPCRMRAQSTSQRQQVRQLPRQARYIGASSSNCSAMAAPSTTSAWPVHYLGLRRELDFFPRAPCHIHHSWLALCHKRKTAERAGQLTAPPGTPCFQGRDPLLRQCGLRLNGHRSGRGSAFRAPLAARASRARELCVPLWLRGSAVR